MKTIKKFKALLFIVLSILLISGQALAKKTKLSINLQKGSKFKIEVVTTGETIMDMMGQEMITSTNSNMGFAFEVINIDDDKNYIIQVVYDHIVNKTGNGMVDMEYDSNNPDKDKNSISAKIFDAIIGGHFIIKLNNKGQVIEVENTEDLEKKIEELVKNIDDPMMGGQMAGLKQAYSSDALKANMEEIFNLLPKKSVKKGSSWEQTSKGEQTMPVKTVNTYKLTEIKDTEVILSSTGIISSQKGSNIMTTEVADMEFNISGNQEGQIKIDLSTGLIIESKVEKFSEGDMTISMDQLPEPMTVPMSIKGTTIIRRYK
ncbi:DUF6263 family protein [Bacteroidota bacterium]